MPTWTHPGTGAPVIYCTQVNGPCRCQDCRQRRSWWRPTVSRFTRARLARHPDSTFWARAVAQTDLTWGCHVWRLTFVD